MNDRSALDLARKCVRCGFCLDACPTYRITGTETLSPRGRIRLMTSVMTGETPLTQEIIASIDACLGCRACETACPSGVSYGRIVEHFRTRIEESGERPRLTQDAKRGIIASMRSPTVFAASLKASRAYAALTHAASDSADGPTIPAPVAHALSGQSPSATVMPDTPDQVAVGSLPTFSPAIGERRFTVCMLQGCVMRVLYHTTNMATIRVLQRAGCDVICPPDLGCCGALDFHAGYHASGVARAAAILATLRNMRFDAFVINSAGCGSTVREYGTLLGDEPVLAGEAAALASKARDVSEFLDEIGIPGSPGRFEAVVTYHDACHLAHGQGITAAPRRLLQSVPGIELVPLRESDMCCGSAGTYNLTQPEMARRLLDRKVDNIIATGAQVVAMGNPGCMAWIARGLKDRHSSIRVMHVVEILDEAIRNASEAGD
jgi:glycolate oxidase iron-sulfur subunit